MFLLCVYLRSVLYARGPGDYRKNAGIIRKQTKMSRVQAISACSLRAEMVSGELQWPRGRFFVFRHHFVTAPRFADGAEGRCFPRGPCGRCTWAVVAQASVTATNVDTTFTYRAESNSRRVGYRPGAYRYVSYSDYSQGIQVIDRGPADTRCTTTAARGRNPGARSSDRKRGSLWHFAVDPDRQASLLRVVVEP